MSDARYRLLTGEEQAALPPAELAKYRRERERFELEVEEHREHIRRHGWLDVGTGGRSVRMAVPVVLNRGRP